MNICCVVNLIHIYVCCLPEKCTGVRVAVPSLLRHCCTHAADSLRLTFHSESFSRMLDLNLNGKCRKEFFFEFKLNSKQLSYGQRRGDYQAFYPRDAMLARVIEIATCLSVRHAPVLCQNEES